MGHPRFLIVDLALLVAAVAMGVHIWREYEFSFRDDLVFATYLGLLTTAALGLWSRNPPSRPLFAGYATFAAVYLVVGLRFGFAGVLGVKCEIGMAYGLMTGVAFRWVRPGGPFGLTGSPPRSTGETLGEETKSVGRGPGPPDS